MLINSKCHWIRQNDQIGEILHGTMSTLNGLKTKPSRKKVEKKWFNQTKCDWNKQKMKYLNLWHSVNAKLL